MVGTLGAELFLARTAFVEAVIGIVLFFGGTSALKILAFPLFLLCFMIPIPAVIYNEMPIPTAAFCQSGGCLRAGTARLSCTS